VDVYFRDEKLCSVVPASPPDFKMVNDRRGPYVDETPKTPFAIAGEINTMVTKRVKERKALSASAGTAKLR
jgi:hypothetical protein